MMKFKAATPDGRPLMAVGLEAGNIERLKRGEPIFFNGEVINFPGMNVLIFYGDTKEKMLEDLKGAGFTFEESLPRDIAAVGPERAFDA